MRDSERHAALFSAANKDHLPPASLLLNAAASLPPVYAPAESERARGEYARTRASARARSHRAAPRGNAGYINGENGRSGKSAQIAYHTHLYCHLLLLLLLLTVFPEVVLVEVVAAEVRERQLTGAKCRAADILIAMTGI